MPAGIKVLVVLFLFNTTLYAKVWETVYIDGVAVDIIKPDIKIKGNILVLPGWGFSRKEWCTKSDLCKKALKEGYCLILPEMGKSVYASHYYPETRREWHSFLTLAWLADTLIKELQAKYGMLKKGSLNYALGLSTGGRGAVLIALKCPGLFSAVAALSGDFNQVLDPEDKLMTGTYGPYKLFPERWKTEDNPSFHARELISPLYLGHGSSDLVVRPVQSEAFYRLVIKESPDNKIVLHLVQGAGHDFNYWNSELDAVFGFFNLYRNN